MRARPTPKRCKDTLSLALAEIGTRFPLLRWGGDMTWCLKKLPTTEQLMGVTNPWRLTLSNGTITHDAAFQSIDLRKNMARVGRRTELQFADSYHFNIAAYHLAVLLGLDDVVPVSVERRWKRQRGALVWWIDSAWDETERKARGLFPPDVAAWSKQLYRTVVFAQLIYDTDRNEGNILYTKDWHVWMIDFTRAFRRWNELPHPESLVTYDAELAKSLKLLDERTIADVTDGHLTPAEIRAVLARRDLILQRFAELKSLGATGR